MLKQAQGGWAQHTPQNSQGVGFSQTFIPQNSPASDVSEWALQGEAVLCFLLL